MNIDSDVFSDITTDGDYVLRVVATEDEGKVYAVYNKRHGVYEYIDSCYPKCVSYLNSASQYCNDLQTEPALDEKELAPLSH